MGCEQVILLDTHVWLWWVHGDRKLPDGLSREILRREAEGLAVSAFSCWELGTLIRRGRVDLGMSIDTWITRSTNDPRIEILPVTKEIAIAAATLPSFPNQDPGDGIIVATAIKHDAVLATCDRFLLDYPGIRCLT